MIKSIDCGANPVMKNRTGPIPEIDCGYNPLSSRAARDLEERENQKRSEDAKKIEKKK